jgi:hypothetical protein
MRLAVLNNCIYLLPAGVDSPRLSDTIAGIAGTTTTVFTLQGGPSRSMADGSDDYMSAPRLTRWGNGGIDVYLPLREDAL